MSVFFNEFEGNPTPTFYAIMVLSIGLFFMVVYKYFQKRQSNTNVTLLLRMRTKAVLFR